MPYVPYGFVHQEQLDTEVVRVNYNIGEDNSGEPSIHFRVVLTDAAARRDTLAKATRSIIDAVNERLTPLSKWEIFYISAFEANLSR